MARSQGTVFENIQRVLIEGFQLPWLTVITKMSAQYLPWYTEQTFGAADLRDCGTDGVGDLDDQHPMETSRHRGADRWPNAARIYAKVSRRCSSPVAAVLSDSGYWPNSAPEAPRMCASMRTSAPATPAMSLPEGWRMVRGSLDDTTPWAHELAGVHTILGSRLVHRKVSAAQHQAVIVRGTESLVAAAERAQVARLLYVSSIAAAFEDQRAYPYAQAEAARRRGGCGVGLMQSLYRAPETPYSDARVLCMTV